MASPGANLAVTKDGESYNKLQRPDDYLVSTNVSLPPLTTTNPSATRSNKRKRDHHAAAGSKRHRPGGNYTEPNDSKGKPRSLGPVRDCGMRTTLPGLDDQEQSSDESIGEALAYLRSVRSEASLIPTLLVASTGDVDNDSGIVDDDDDDDNDEHNSNEPEIDRRVVYHDGIWIAVDDEPNRTEDEDNWDDTGDGSASQQSCYKMLLKRFQVFQRRLVESKCYNTEKRKTTTPNKSDDERQPSSKRAWLQTIEQNYPTLDRVFKLNETTLFHAIQACTSSLAHSQTITRQKSCWIWTLLASVGDAGTLDHERISKIRDLGVQAGRLRTRLWWTASHDHNDEEGPIIVEGKKPLSNVGEHVKGRNDVARTSADSDSGATETESLTRETANHDDLLLELGDNDQRGQQSGEGLSQSDADMSMSEDEGEVHESADTEELEQARARLLAQLGDRLVQPRGPSDAKASSLTEMQTQDHSSQGITDQSLRKRQSESHHGGLQHEACPRTESDASDGIEADSTAVVEAELNTRATIDMVLTIVAECYGQKDLLRLREAW